VQAGSRKKADMGGLCNNCGPMLFGEGMAGVGLSKSCCCCSGRDKTAGMHRFRMAMCGTQASLTVKARQLRGDLQAIKARKSWQGVLSGACWKLGRLLPSVQLASAGSPGWSPRFFVEAFSNPLSRTQLEPVRVRTHMPRVSGSRRSDGYLMKSPGSRAA
jgi:hypothetical protein